MPRLVPETLRHFPGDRTATKGHQVQHLIHLLGGDRVGLEEIVKLPEAGLGGGDDQPRRKPRNGATPVPGPIMIIGRWGLPRSDWSPPLARLC